MTIEVRAKRALYRAAGVEDLLRDAARRVTDSEQKVAQLAQHQQVLEEVTTLLSSMEAAWRKGFEDALTDMVSRGLTLVLGEPTFFTINSKPRGGIPSLEFQLEQQGVEMDVMEAKGGTLVQLVDFLLRLAVVLTAQPPLRKVLLLDEAFAHVSVEYVPALADLLRQLCDETKTQFILVTHDPAYIDAADVVYEVSQRRGVSHYERVKSKRDLL